MGHAADTAQATAAKKLAGIQLRIELFAIQFNRSAGTFYPTDLAGTNAIYHDQQDAISITTPEEAVELTSLPNGRGSDSACEVDD